MNSVVNFESSRKWTNKTQNQFLNAIQSHVNPFVLNWSHKVFFSFNAECNTKYYFDLKISIKLWFRVFAINTICYCVVVVCDCLFFYLKVFIHHKPMLHNFYCVTRTNTPKVNHTHTMAERKIKAYMENLPEITGILKCLKSIESIMPHAQKKNKNYKNEKC